MVQITRSKVKMSSGQDAVIAVREQRARIGGIEAVKKTVIAATDAKNTNRLHSEVVCLAAIATFSTQGIAAFDLRYPPNVSV